MLKKLSHLFTLVALVLPLLFSKTSFALGFGDITVFSTLNEPLKVHIELLDSESMLLDEIIVKNASLSTYRRANLPRPVAFNKVRFTPTKLANGSIIVVLTSKHPIREPFITFIADMSWRTGHINKEYTFLIDPPEFVQKHSRPAPLKKIPIKEKTSTTVKNSYKKKSSSSTHQRTPAIEQSAVIAAHTSDNTYLTQKADTLWEIARRVKPDNSVSTYETMQAIFVLNSRAFIDGDINLLKQGEVLSIPSANEILQLNGKVPKPQSSKTTSKASTIVNTRLKTQKPSAHVIESPSDKKARASETDSKTVQKTDVKDEAHLKIIPPTEGLLNRPVTKREDLRLINNALKTSVDAISLLKDENEDLSAQIENLTKKLNSLDSHNENLNTQIAEITTFLKDKKSSAETIDDREGDIQESDIPGDSQITNKQISTNEQDINKPVSLEINSDLSQQRKSRSFVRDLLTSPVITFTLAILTVIILITFLLTIRKQNEKRRHRYDNTHRYNKDYNQPQGDTKTNLISRQTVIPEQSKSHFETESEKTEDEMDFFEYFEKQINAPEEPSDKDNNAINNLTKHQSLASEDSSEINFSLDISDDEFQNYEHPKNNTSDDHKLKLLSEIDTYLAYGNYDKAEELILQVIQGSHSDKNLHLKLLECYSLNNKRYEFMQHVKDITKLLNLDMVLRQRVEKVYQQTWNEKLSINKLN